MRLPVILPALLLLSACFGLIACTDVGYLRQCTLGHLDLLARRQPITAVLADPQVPAATKERLRSILELRDFASRNLYLPDNGSYRCFADLQRSHVVWNVVAAPEFSLQPKQWCFPVAGCVPYRGYFDRERAHAYAEKLRADGYDVYVYGVTAYSTLGWFDDPVLNTFFQRREEDIGGLIFHELAHQKLYVKGDASFNEAFAETVEREGVERWLRQRSPDAVAAYRQRRERQQRFLVLIQGAREELARWYAEEREPASMRAGKERIFARLHRASVSLDPVHAGRIRWLEQDLNNAKLASLATYETNVAAFRQLLLQVDGDLARFYREAAEMARLPAEKRSALLDRLRAAFQSPGPVRQPPAGSADLARDHPSASTAAASPSL